MNKIKKMTRKGFTLVELVVVIAIIAILGAVSVVGYLGFVDNAKQSAAEQEAEQIETVLIAGAADKNSGFKLTDAGLVLDDGAAVHEGYNLTTTKGNTQLDIVLSYYFKMTETKVLAQGVTFVEYDSDNSVELNDNTITGIAYIAANGKTANISFKK